MKLRWAEPALEDLEAIYAFIAKDNPKAAHRVLERIYDAVRENLPNAPSMGRPGRVAGTRELVISGLPFIVPYRVRDDSVQILRVLHGVRDWPDAF